MIELKDISNLFFLLLLYCLHWILLNLNYASSLLTFLNDWLKKKNIYINFLLLWWNCTNITFIRFIFFEKKWVADLVTIKISHRFDHRFGHRFSHIFGYEFGHKFSDRFNHRFGHWFSHYTSVTNKIVNDDVWSLNHSLIWSFSYRFLLTIFFFL